MKIVIEIPEEYYKAIKGISDDTSTADMLLIKNGTPLPLPKGHGRLMILSENKLKENQINLDSSCQKWISEVGLSNATVTIIDVDKAESEE